MFNRVTALSVTGSDFTNEKVEIIARFTSLQELSLTETAVDRMGAARIAAALPQCKVLIVQNDKIEVVRADNSSW